MPFSDILGQDYAVKVIRRSLEHNRLSHAYLFSGPEGVGKKFTARIFSQALNCTNGKSKEKFDGCGKCLSCRKIISGNHPEVRFVRPQGELVKEKKAEGWSGEPEEGAVRGPARGIKIDQIRELQKEIMHKPYESRFRVYILTQVESKGLESANCLLKVLEEPPSYGILILIATNLQALPQTLVSRCQLIPFNLVPLPQIVNILNQHFSPPLRAGETIARISGGQPGKAIKLGENNLLIRDKVLNLLEGLSRTEPVSVLRAAGELIKISEEEEAANKIPQRNIILEELEIIALWYRDLLILKEKGIIRLLINVDKLEQLKEKSASYSREQLLEIIKQVEETKEFVRQNANSLLALEVMLLKINQNI